ncbi:hypothetical protein JB92DRAFT_1339401 [Gautieria morchelliformis]|nr:hypothetical protein JB92DRAFT_1339401 [Gautieria morchelliformis]
MRRSPTPPYLVAAPTSMPLQAACDPVHAVGSPASLPWLCSFFFPFCLFSSGCLSLTSIRQNLNHRLSCVALPPSHSLFCPPPTPFPPILSLFTSCPAPLKCFFPSGAFLMPSAVVAFCSALCTCIFTRPRPSIVFFAAATSLCAGVPLLPS